MTENRNKPKRWGVRVPPPVTRDEITIEPENMRGLVRNLLRAGVPVLIGRKLLCTPSESFLTNIPDEIVLRKVSPNIHAIRGQHPELCYHLIERVGRFVQIWPTRSKLGRPLYRVVRHDQASLDAWRMDAQKVRRELQQACAPIRPPECVEGRQHRTQWWGGRVPMLVTGDGPYALLRAPRGGALRKWLRYWRRGRLEWLESMECWRMPASWARELESQFRRDGIRLVRVYGSARDAYRRVDGRQGPSWGLWSLFPRAAAEAMALLRRWRASWIRRLPEARIPIVSMILDEDIPSLIQVRSDFLFLLRRRYSGLPQPQAP